MFSFRRSVLLLVFSVSASLGLQAQSSSASSAQATEPAATAPTAPKTTGPLTVQARIKARREQRRAAAIHDVYSHLYELYVGAGYIRFLPGAGAISGKGLQKINEYSWDVGATRYFNEHLGVTLDGRGNYGSAYIGPNEYSNTAVFKPAISQYTAMIGPTYRFVLNPKYSISGRVLAGGAFGNFSGDLGHYTPAGLGLYPDGAGVAVSASVPLEYNVSPGVGIRIAPEYFITSFGSSIQASPGFTGGIVVRWGKQ
jgi:hypothetical protein